MLHRLVYGYLSAGISMQAKLFKANDWRLEVKIYRDQCPEIKQRAVDKVSDTDIRQAIASMVSSPGGNCDVLQDLADNDPPAGRVSNRK